MLTTAAMVLVIALAAAGGTARPGAPPPDEGRAPRPVRIQPGEAARLAAAIEQFDAVDLSGRRWKAADLRGRVLLLDFWATWCAPCLADLPHLKALRARHPQDRFEILGISLDVASRRSFVSWLNRHRIEWPQVHERAGYAAAIPRQFGIDRLPRTVVLSPEGVPVAVDVRGAELVALVDELVASGQPGPAPEGERP